MAVDDGMAYCHLHGTCCSCCPRCLLSVVKLVSFAWARLGAFLSRYAWNGALDIFCCYLAIVVSVVVVTVLARIRSCSCSSQQPKSSSWYSLLPLAIIIIVVVTVDVIVTSIVITILPSPLLKQQQLSVPYSLLSLCDKRTL